jgi:hypothetical protein
LAPAWQFDVAQLGVKTLAWISEKLAPKPPGGGGGGGGGCDPPLIFATALS